MMADFQNGLICRACGAFWGSFLHRTTVNDL